MLSTYNSSQRDLRYHSAGLLTELCHSVEVELSLQPSSGESSASYSIYQLMLSLDVMANVFWECRLKIYFDVKVFNLSVPTVSVLQACGASKEQKIIMKRGFEHGTFSP